MNENASNQKIYQGSKVYGLEKLVIRKLGKIITFWIRKAGNQKSRQYSELVELEKLIIRKPGLIVKFTSTKSWQSEKKARL